MAKYKFKVSISHSQTILNISEMTVLIIIMNDMRAAYSKKNDAFYQKEPMFITIPFDRVIPVIKEHVRRSGINRYEVDKWFRNIKNIYNLIGALRKSVLFLSVSVECIDDYTTILGYNEYRRGKIRFFRIEPIKGSIYNTQKYKEIGKHIKLRIKGILNEERIDKYTLNKELNRNEKCFNPYNPYR